MNDTHLPVGGLPVANDGCLEESGSFVYVEDDFATEVSVGFFLTDPVDARVITGFTFSAARGRTGDTRLFSPTGRWFLYNCGDQFYFLPEGGPAETFDGLVLDIMNELDPPDPVLALTPDHGSHVVRMPSWFAVDPAYWNEDRTARAQEPGSRFFVQASLEPTVVEWDPGDGEDVLECFNPGTVWRSGLDESLNDCDYTYSQPSINPPSNEWDLSGTIVFEVVNVQTNPELNPADFGPWPPVIRTTTQTIEVVEIQAVGRANTSP